MFPQMASAGLRHQGLTIQGRNFHMLLPISHHTQKNIQQEKEEEESHLELHVGFVNEKQHGTRLNNL